MTASDLITEARSLTASIATDSLRSLQDTQLARARMLLEDMADALEAAQRPPDEIEAALEYAWDDGNASGLDGWTGPGRGAGEVDQQAIYNRDRAIRTALEKLGETRRPPLGYAVAEHPGDGLPPNIEDTHPTREGAETDAQAMRDAASFSQDYRVYEVREVHP